jgi:exodeoxyribonuclease V alpha subunit
LTNEPGRPRCSLNIELQRELNPPRESRIERFGWTFCPGDKVMQSRTTTTGTSTTAISVSYPASIWENCELVADFDGREVTYGFGELDTLGKRRVRQAR